ncbi:MAG: metal-dependent transcriptional regulator [Bacteroidetes bacterium]|nr:metal-dependent transcriptional regulator [Bacteroidota bacterium]
MANLTATIEDYLQAIYSLEGEGDIVRSARLARRMRVTPPTAWATVRRMIRDGLVELDDKKIIRLTGKGHELAEDITRRHRLAERFLVDVMGRIVATLFEGDVAAGQVQTVRIDGAGLPSGTYAVRLTGETFSDALTVTLLK